MSFKKKKKKFTCSGTKVERIISIFQDFYAFFQKNKNKKVKRKREKK